MLLDEHGPGIGSRKSPKVKPCLGEHLPPIPAGSAKANTENIVCHSKYTRGSSWDSGTLPKHSGRAVGCVSWSSGCQSLPCPEGQPAWPGRLPGQEEQKSQIIPGAAVFSLPSWVWSLQSPHSLAVTRRCCLFQLSSHFLRESALIALIFINSSVIITQSQPQGMAPAGINFVPRQPQELETLCISLG